MKFSLTNEKFQMIVIFEKKVEVTPTEFLADWNRTHEEKMISAEDITGKHVCKYCGEVAEGDYEDLLCADCRETFGHSLYSEL